ncbi:MAG: efflux RND transporter periplasmic adaptor subunit [Cyanobacteria bacterium P01_F01_bin.150]
MKLSHAQSSHLQVDVSSSSALHRTSQTANWVWTILIAVLLGSLAALWWVFGRSRPQPTMETGPVPVDILALETSTLEDRSSFIGTLDAQQGVVLKPEMDGQIVNIFVDSGDTVSVGDPILRLSPDRSQAEVNTAIANTRIARAAVTNAEAQVRTAEAEKVRAEAEVALQEEEIQRIQYLVEEGAESQQQLDVVTRNWERAIASLDVATERVQESQASVKEAEAALSQSQSQVNIVQADLQDTLVTAPINGVIGDMVTKQGDYVETGDALTSITQNQTLDLSLAVPIEYRDRLSLGLPVEIRRSPEDDQGVTGRVSFIAPQVNPATQTLTVEASFENATNILFDDQRVEAAIIWQQRSGVLVPATAISRLAGQPFIFVVTDATNEETGESKLIAQQRSVTLGDIQGNQYQVLEGLEAGDAIVVSGILKLSNGMAIVGQEELEEQGS